MENLVLLSKEEQNIRLGKVRQALALAGCDSAIVSSNANLYYLTGRVFSGYMYIAAGIDEPVYFVKRPVHLSAPCTVPIRKPEQMAQELQVRSLPLPTAATAIELGRLTYNMASRLFKAFGTPMPDANPALALARATKTEHELALMRISGAKHERVYRKIPFLFQPGMTDLELQVEIERLSRLEGCLGQFRVQGEDMEIYMGNVLAGDNADAPSPYDFAMGGAGLDPSLPVGANGTPIKPGMAVMVDMNGNFTGYMTDMTRTYAYGKLDELALLAHQTSIDICHALAKMGRPGVEARALYEKAEEMVKAVALEPYFMGHRQHAGFIGHGVGIEINELPVISPRSKDILAEGNTIALEPKFVIPRVGAVGIENTYAVGADGMACITNAPEEILQLDK